MMVKKTQAANPLAEQMAADAAAQDVSPDVLARITTTAHELKQLLHRIAGGEKLLQDLQGQVSRIRNEVLPGLMDEAGVKDLTLDDGAQIVRGEEVYASLAKEKRKAACDWLVKHGYGGLVKNQFSIALPRGSTPEAQRIAALLRKARVKFEFGQTVHASTLLAFVKESIEAGRKLPPTITVHVQPVVRVKDAATTR
jgi:hypothetical protein